MTFEIVLGTVGEFIEIAQTITSIFIVYYLIRFLFYRDAKTETAKGNGAELFTSLNELRENHKEKQKNQEKLDGRKQYLNKSLGFLHRALLASQELQECLHTNTRSEIDKATHGTTLVRSALSSARRNSRGAHRHHKDDMTEDLHELHTAIHAVLEQCDELLEKNIPEDEEDRYFDAKARHFREGAQKISGYIAALYSNVRAFIEKHDQKSLQISASLKHLEETVAKHQKKMKALRKEAAQGQAREGAVEDLEERKAAKDQAGKKEKKKGKIVGARPAVAIREGKKKKK